MQTLRILAALLFLASTSFAQDAAALRKRAQTAQRAGNHLDAYNLYTQYIYEVTADAAALAGDVPEVMRCLVQLNRDNETDAVREQLAAAHADQWRILHAVARSYQNANSWGFLIAGEFERGHHRGGGQWASSAERDRVRALQLMDQALPLLADEPNAPDAARFHLDFASLLLQGRGQRGAWQLAVLTDWSVLPDYEEGGHRGHFGHTGQSRGAPVDEEGNPVFYRIPESFEAAATDGERWRWLLARAKEIHPPFEDEVRFAQAGFLRDQFGVQTMADYRWFFHRPAEEESPEGDTSGTYQLHTLGRDETIARLAIGIRRFSLPDEFNHITHYQALADTPNSAFGERSLDALVEIFNNRRQYPQAMEQLNEAIRRFGPGHRNRRVNLLQQITGNWGRFEESLTRAAGEEATLQYRFRNGTRVRFSAQRVDTPALLGAVKEYLRNNPSQIEWERIRLDQIGAMLMEKHGAKFVRETVAEWTQNLEPLPDHFDRRVTVPTPLKEAGAYLVTARMDNGNTSKIVLWLSDTVLVKKTLATETEEEDVGDGGTLYFVADARTGAPVPGAIVDFFGYWVEHVEDQGRRRHHNIRTTQFAETADDEGFVIPSQRDLMNQHPWQRPRWLITATDETGRFAFLGFSHVWRSSWREAQYRQTKTYGITDRPVYRPDQNVHFKFWIGHAQYDQDDHSAFAGRTFTVRIRNPRGDEVHSDNFTADEYGGFHGEYAIPDGAPLGVYQIHVDSFGSVAFRVEEYRKPEFEVRVEAPSEPVMLGETIEATIHADYYFGAPVTQARVSYKVLRTPTTQTWYPPAPWDWFYGPGYWWFAYDYDWFPGWHRWGCIRPLPWWIHRPTPPPEIIAENEVEIGEDGTVTVAFDTAVTKAMHGHTDHRYQIMAEVTDASRRTIVGQGEVLVARRPFKVFVWVNRGFYHPGETVRADFSARTLDNRPVPGMGRARLFRIRYDEERNPIEDEVEAWDLEIDPRGQASLKLVAAEPGQYRLSLTLTDSRGREEEGGYLFVVRGEAFTDEGFRFARIELVPDQKEYGPGDEVQLAVNTEQENSTVLLFLRPSNGVYLRPQMLRLEGKSQIVSVPISRKDMPNFFIEALTVSDGNVHTEVREIIVPPEDRVVEVEVEPDSDSYLPGAPATVRVRVRDHLGNPFVGSTVMTVYDRAVEYISGGSNVPDIREFFWKWRRRHNERTEHSQARRFWNMVPKGQTAMQALGIFGGTVADEVGMDSRAPRAARGLIAADGPDRMVAMEYGDMVPFEAAPAPAAAPMRAEAEPAEPDAPLVEAHVRTEFADTAFWSAEIETDEEGMAEVSFDMPESLTGWKIRTWTLGAGSRVGESTTEVVTFKNLLLRLQAPRFFVEKDEVVLSANIHNYLETDKEVLAILELDGDALAILDDRMQTVTVEANGERRVDWRVRAVREGEVVVRMKALTDEESDAMELRYPVFVHGMLKTDSYSGAIRPDEESGGFTIVVPLERRIEQSLLEIRYSPTLAGAMVDALPYLVGYPYGCTEQTLSRFLPTVITHKILKEMGLDLNDIREKRANLNAQEIGEDVERAKQWQRWDHNPVFDEAEVERMVRDGLKALYDMQLSDGGWGWFSGYGERSGAHTTAYVVHGLLRARAADLAVVPGVLDRGLAWLERYQNEQVRRLRDEKRGKRHVDNLDAFVFRVLVSAGRTNDAMREFLYRDRVDHLSVYGKALFALALHDLKDAPGRDALIHNIEQFLVMDDENQTAYLNLPNSGYWWFWYGSEWETHAYYLKLLSATQPDSPKASGLVKYLLNNRKHATYWTSTRDTAVCIEAMADYLMASGEMAPDLHVEIFVDGEKKKEVHITSENLFHFDNRLVLAGAELEAGERQVEIRKSGQGPLYYNAYLTNFTLEDFITRAGLEVQVDRFYYRLRRVDRDVHVAGARGQAVAQRVERYERERIENLGELTSGELVEVELVIESRNDYEYLVFEDMKPAGFEPVNVRSGYDGNPLRAYVEYRDEKVVFFVRALARGRHSVSYRMRAEIPGQFSALPTRGYAMYAPEIRANSDEIKLIVTD